MYIIYIEYIEYRLWIYIHFINLKSLIFRALCIII